MKLINCYFQTEVHNSRISVLLSIVSLILYCLQMPKATNAAM